MAATLFHMLPRFRLRRALAAQTDGNATSVTNTMSFSQAGN